MGSTTTNKVVSICCCIDQRAKASIGNVAGIFAITFYNVFRAEGIFVFLKVSAKMAVAAAVLALTPWAAQQ